MTDRITLLQHRPTRTGALAAQEERRGDSRGSFCIRFHKRDDELRRALRWAQDDGWFPTVGELDLLRAEYRLAIARAA